MEYQEIINLLDNTPNHPAKSRTKNWVEINDDSSGKYESNDEIRFKNSMLKSTSCGYSHAYTLLSGTITITGKGANDYAKGTDKRNKKVIFKNCALFLKYAVEINNAKIDHAKDLVLLMAMYNLKDSSNNYSKKSGSLCQYNRDQPALDSNGKIVDLPSNSFLFKLKVKITEKYPADDNTKDVKIAASLKGFSNFCSTLNMYLINCETGKGTFAITNTKLYTAVVTLLTRDNVILLKHLKSVLKEQYLFGIYINQKINKKTKPTFRLLN